MALSPVNKVFTILQAPQQSREMPQAFAARQAAVACQRDVVSGAIAPNNAISTEEGSAFMVDPVCRLCHSTGPQCQALMWDDLYHPISVP